MTTTAQHEFEMALEEALKFPLCSVGAAKSHWQKSTDFVRAAADEIEYAWDISHPDAEKRQELRFYLPCVLAWKAKIKGGVCGLTEREVYQRILPAHAARYKVTTIAERFDCTADHVAHLITAGCLTKLTAAQRGPSGSPEVTRESVIQFLKTRRVSQ